MTRQKKVHSVTRWEPTEIWEGLSEGGWVREKVAAGLARLSEEGMGWGAANKD